MSKYKTVGTSTLQKNEKKSPWYSDQDQIG